MSLVNWAENELNRLGKDEDGMQKVMNDDILEVVKIFSEQGHSGFSASYAINIIKRLLAWKPISPLTGEDDEWGGLQEWDNGSKTQQNKRCSAVFRDNYDNSTAHYIDGQVFSDDGGQSWFSKGGKGLSITFPFMVPEKPEYIIIE